MILVLGSSNSIWPNYHLVVLSLRSKEGTEVDPLGERDKVVNLFQRRKASGVHVGRGVFVGLLEPLKVEDENGRCSGDHVPLEGSLKHEVLGLSPLRGRWPDDAESADWTFITALLG